MGWSELKFIPNKYNDEFKSIDEQLIQLIMKRKALSKGQRFYPPQEIIQEWAESYELEVPYIHGLLHSFSDNGHHARPEGPGELTGVVPIMKTTLMDGFQYTLTHAMQHEHASIISLEIKRSQNEDHYVLVRPQLLLEVLCQEKDYSVSRNSSHGGGGDAEMSFLVAPRLPDKLDGIGFKLIPHASPMEDRPKEIFLNQEVNFE